MNSGPNPKVITDSRLANDIVYIKDKVISVTDFMTLVVCIIVFDVKNMTLPTDCHPKCPF